MDTYRPVRATGKGGKRGCPCAAGRGRPDGGGRRGGGEASGLGPGGRLPLPVLARTLLFRQPAPPKKTHLARPPWPGRACRHPGQVSGRGRGAGVGVEAGVRPGRGRGREKKKRGRAKNAAAPARRRVGFLPSYAGSGGARDVHGCKPGQGWALDDQFFDGWERQGWHSGKRGGVGVAPAGADAVRGLSPRPFPPLRRAAAPLVFSLSSLTSGRPAGAGVAVAKSASGRGTSIL